jgi:hypothetical protein
MRNKTITVDLEAWSPTVLSNTTSGIHPGKSSLYMKILKNRMYGTNLCKEILFPMQLESKYKFSRANWYQAEFKPEDYHAVDAWCSQQFGPHPPRPDAWSRWWHKFEYSIRDQDDYMMFVLRWGTP